MTNERTKKLIETALYAALIYLSIQVFRIPVGAQFIHIGNALVAVGILVFGFKQGALAAALGLFIFDVTNGYVAESWIIVLEALIVALVLHLYFDVLFKRNDKTSVIIGAGLLAAITKIALNFLKYTFRNLVFAALPLGAAATEALIKIGGTFGSALVTVIAVPLLYPVFKQIIKRRG